MAGFSMYKSLCMIYMFVPLSPLFHELSHLLLAILPCNQSRTMKTASILPAIHLHHSKPLPRYLYLHLFRLLSHSRLRMNWKIPSVAGIRLSKNIINKCYKSIFLIHYSSNFVNIYSCSLNDIILFKKYNYATFSRF